VTPPNRIAIIGAGPAGLTAAYCLAKAGIAADVYEASPAAGGMCRTIELWGQHVDIGPHRFFSTDKIVNELWLEVIDGEYEMVNRLTRIYYKRKFFQYPLKGVDALKKLGPEETIKVLASYVQTRLGKRSDNGSFQDWVTNKFGKRLFEIFFKNYSEKLWGIPCTELDADFAAQRIKKFSLTAAIRHAVTTGKQKHKTLVSQFAYPKKGTGRVYEKMKLAAEAMGAKFYFDTPVAAVSLDEQGKVNGIKTGSGFHEYDTVISTMPLTLMLRSLPNVPSAVLDSTKKLTFRNTIIVYLLVNGKDLFPDNWLYIQEPEVRMGRITNFRNWSRDLYGNSEQTILALEYWCYSLDDLWTMPHENLITLAKEELNSIGLLKGATISEGYVYKIPNCYPVYHKGYKSDLEPVMNYLDTIPGLACIGRYGSFKYNNQDHSILMGILAAENISKGTNHNLWAINTDYESYQEQTLITETGLVKT
jgi:protoporphyrinogen oxidase